MSESINVNSLSKMPFEDLELEFEKFSFSCFDKDNGVACYEFTRNGRDFNINVIYDDNEIFNEITPDELINYYKVAFLSFTIGDTNAESYECIFTYKR